MDVLKLIEHQLLTKSAWIKGKLGKAPKWVYPILCEVQYRKILLLFIARLKSEVKQKILPQLPGLIAQANAHKNDSIKMDVWSDDLDGLMSNFSDAISGVFPTNQQLGILTTMSQNVTRFNAEQWYKICKHVLGVDIYTNMPQLTDRLQAFTHDNITLIDDLKAQVYKDVRLTVSNGIRNGDRYSTISNNLFANTELTRGVFTKVETRAALIARDQVSKLNGDIANYRQKSAGIDTYYWRGMEDERERATHEEMNDSLCKWNDSNVYSLDNGKTWIARPKAMQGKKPGSDYNCRCYAEPNFSSIIK